MVQKQRSYYLDLRREFEPTGIKLVIVAESPPESESGKYFYIPGGTVSELLFKALMKQLCIQPKTKPEGLRKFQNRGWVLVDATYEPVNKNTAPDLVIERDYPELCGDLKRLLATRWSEVPLVLIKANVCKLLEPKLKKDGFNVLNKKDRMVPFPSHGHQPVFDSRFREIVPQTLRCDGLYAETKR